MTDFSQTDEQRILAESLRRFLDKENAFEQHRHRLMAKPPQRLSLWTGLAEMGVLGAAFTEAQGGFAGDARSVAAVMAELGRALTVEPYLGCAIVAGRLLQQTEDAGDMIEKIIAGEEIVVLAHDAGHEPFGLPLLVARKDGDGFVLDGVVRHVRHADVAGIFLVTARLADETIIVRIPRAAAGLAVEGYRLMDGAGAGHLRFTGASVPAAARLALSGDAATLVDDALEWGVMAQAAEAAGIVSALNHATFQYLMTRQQFGVVIGTFQALQHRAADLYIAEQELAAATEMAIEALAQAPSNERSATVSAAKVTADRAGRLCAHEAIQMHGGMGVSDELNVSYYARRLAAMRAEFGSADSHRLRFAGTGLDPRSTGFALPESAEDSAWRQEVRDFVKTHLPKDIARKGELGLKIEKDDYVRWQKILREQDWFAAKWPAEHGGESWDLRKQFVFTQEAAVCNAPMISPYGVSMVGPVLYTYGNQAQRAQHLPGILSNEVWWCQGYSEPGAGSDLAGIKTFAVLEGDEYVVNGAKMWTTEAHWADWMHCLVRTGREGKPQNGITFLLIDMKTPGIEIKPIVTIDGIHHTNAVFLDNVRVPVTNRVGDEGRGWSLAKFLLGNERVSIADTGPKLRLLKRVRGMMEKALTSDDIPAAIKCALSLKLSDVSIQLMTLCSLERHYVDQWASGKPAGPEASLLKIRGTEILQTLSEVALEIEGPLGAAHDPDDLHRDPLTSFNDTQQASLNAYEYLYGRCWSIFGGTNEVQRNIIAKQLLGV